MKRNSMPINWGCFPFFAFFLYFLIKNPFLSKYLKRLFPISKGSAHSYVKLKEKFAPTVCKITDVINAANISVQTLWYMEPFPYKQWNSAFINWSVWFYYPLLIFCLHCKALLRKRFKENIGKESGGIKSSLNKGLVMWTERKQTGENEHFTLIRFKWRKYFYQNQVMEL